MACMIMKWDYCMTIDYATKNGRPFVQKKRRLTSEF